MLNAIHTVATASTHSISFLQLIAQRHITKNETDSQHLSSNLLSELENNVH